MSNDTQMSAFVQRSPATSPVADLVLHHYEQHVVGSGIADWVASQRRYRTVTAADADLLRKLGFNEDQIAHVPALLIPLWDIHGNIVNYELRPDVSRVNEDGEPNKYERVGGRSVVLDVHPSARHHVDKMDVPLFITEGIKKADAVLSAKIPKGGAVLPIGLQGVACWCSEGHALADWWRIPVRGRMVYVCYDSDVMVKEAVHRELVKLVGFLKSRGAVIKPIYLPPGPSGEKVGIDDYLAAGHTLTDALNLAEDDLRPLTGRRSWLSFAELLNLPSLPWLIEDLLPAEGVAAVFGSWGAYKSFVVLDWLATVAGSIDDWFGLAVRKHGPCVYVYAEGRAGLGQRVQAVSLARRLAPDTPLVVWPTAQNIADPAVVEQLIAEIGVALDGARPVMIAIDTLARNMPGRDENKQQDMGAFIAGCDRLRTAFECLVIIVHHENREGEVRGSTVLPGAADTLIEVKRKADNETRLKVRKQKDGEEPAWRVRLRPEAASLVVAGIEPVVEDDQPGRATRTIRDTLLDQKQPMAVFRALAKAESPGGLTYGDWFKAAGVSKGTFTTAKNEMEDRAFAVQDGETGKYRLTLRGAEIASARGWIEIPV